MLFPQFTQELPPSVISQQALAVFGYKFLHPSPSCALLELQRLELVLSPLDAPRARLGAGAQGQPVPLPADPRRNERASAGGEQARNK